MRPIVITTEISENPILECKIIAELINKFGCNVHLRKKKESREVTELYCMLLSEFTDMSYITIHGYPDLVAGFEIGGYHDTPEMIKKYRKTLPKNTVFSVSCHSMEEADKADADYLFLSPIYDSTSKKGYKSNFAQEDLKEWLQSYTNSAKVVALGGINRDNIGEVYSTGFFAAAILGAIWESSNPVKEYETLLNKYKHI